SCGGGACVWAASWGGRISALLSRCTHISFLYVPPGGARARYVDVLNPGGNKPTSSVPPPADLFAPLAPMPIPTNLFVPNAVPQEAQPPVGSEAEVMPPSEQPGVEGTQQFVNSALGPDHQDDVPPGEVRSRVMGPGVCITAYNIHVM
ncbi:hypothetical protein GDO81_026343, partial [Engystomops pustulosus]